MRLRRPLTVLASSVAVLLVSPARADDTPSPSSPSPPPRSISTAGTIVFDEVLAVRSSGLPITAGWLSYRTSTTRPEGGPETSMTQLRFAPSLDVFVVDGLSVGGQASIGRAAIEAGGVRMTTSTREIAPRVGYAFPIADGLAFWPRVYAAYGWGETDTESTSGGGGALGAVGSTPAAGRAFRIGGDASLALSLGRWVALGAGPTIAYAWQRSDGTTLAPARTVTTSFDVAIAASLRLVL